MPYYNTTYVAWHKEKDNLLGHYCCFALSCRFNSVCEFVILGMEWEKVNKDLRQNSKARDSQGPNENIGSRTGIFEKRKKWKQAGRQVTKIINLEKVINLNLIWSMWSVKSLIKIDFIYILFFGNYEEDFLLYTL